MEQGENETYLAASAKKIRRELLKSALYLRLIKSAVFKICPGRFYEKLRKQFRDTQRVHFVLDKTPNHFSPTGNKSCFFFWKKSHFFFRKMSHSAEKCKRADLFEFINIQSVAKYQKNSKEGPFSLVPFVDYVKESKKWKRGPFALSLHCRTWPE